jgi:hypothetical protein
MPANPRSRGIFSYEDFHELYRTALGESGNSFAQRSEEFRDRGRRAHPGALIFVTSSEVRYPSLGDDTVHPDLSKLKFANRANELSFFIARNELGRID